MSLYELLGRDASEVVSRSQQPALQARNPEKKNDPETLATSASARHERSRTQRAEFDAWSQRAQLWAQDARKMRDAHPDSPTAYSRLAHAEQNAGNSEPAISAAEACLKLVYKQSAESGFHSFDYASTFAAVGTLVESGQSDLAEALLNDLPSTQEMRRLRATLAVEKGRADFALKLLSGDESAEAASLRGYVYMTQSRFDKALHELRLAWNEDDRRADTALNISACFSKLGSGAKAISFARQAAQRAPSRRDISLILLDLLTSSGQIESGRREVRRLRSIDDVPTLASVLAEARLELSAGAREKGVRLIQVAVRGARNAGLSGLVRELDANILLLTSESDQDRDLARIQVKRHSDENPESISLVRTLAHLSRKRQHFADLKESFERIEKRCEIDSLHALKARVAYLNCDFPAMLEHTDRWRQAELLSPIAWSEHSILLGQVADDWRAAGRQAMETLRRFGPRRETANNLAYTLALAGRSDIAEKVLEQTGFETFYQRATAGLVQIVKGDLDGGLKLYREAANQADKQDDGGRSRALMTMHQGFALRQLGLLPLSEMALTAKALPAVSPPSDWSTWPAFVLLHDAAERRGWPWPLSID